MLDQDSRKCLYWLVVDWAAGSWTAY